LQARSYREIPNSTLKTQQTQTRLNNLTLHHYPQKTHDTPKKRPHSAPHPNPTHHKNKTLPSLPFIRIYNQRMIVNYIPSINKSLKLKSILNYNNYKKVLIFD
jgi:hypothetical protein